ncbi:homoprotocatechuate degradation operon regulator HpaR [Marinibacterium profundimaris]|uniref:MarR family transcriptional regulator n=1 Tax=Marinibacterium profundimaris TaxID=1679460 RepID=A0A225NNB6_9RHOB|nr:homoprotocatechuate degradation operon regulator HpaR [Marinibacterium profundimaris]OWU75925.1 MarR family transcriptional regulator [Marinibacterium profundimaris]
MPAKITPTSRSLPIVLLRAREQVMGPIRTMLADVGITEQQWRVLRVLDEFGPSDPTRIADAASLLLPSLTRILQKLDAKRLIERSTDPVDRRRQIVQITPAGSRLIADNLASSVRLTRSVEDRLGTEKYNQLLDLLSELSALDLNDKS